MSRNDVSVFLPILVYPPANINDYGRSPCLMGQLTISMAIFNSKLQQSLPEGIPIFFQSDSKIIPMIFSSYPQCIPLIFPSEVIQLRNPSIQKQGPAFFTIDWLKGKITGKSHVSWENLWFPVDFFPSTNPLIFTSSFTSLGELFTSRGERLF